MQLRREQRARQGSWPPDVDGLSRAGHHRFSVHRPREGLLQHLMVGKQSHGRAGVPAVLPSTDQAQETPPLPGLVQRVLLELALQERLEQHRLPRTGAGQPPNAGARGSTEDVLRDQGAAACHDVRGQGSREERPRMEQAVPGVFLHDKSER